MALTGTAHPGAHKAGANADNAADSAGSGEAPPDVRGDGPDADPESVARAIVLRQLTAAPRSRAELAAVLSRRGVPDDVAERVLDRFVEVALVDDAAYANAWVESRHRGRGLSRRALAQELHRHGVDGAAAEEALAQVDHDQERLTARRLVDTKLTSMRGLDSVTRRRRLLAMLARKGYSNGLAAAIVGEALADGGAPEHPAPWEQ